MPCRGAGLGQTGQADALQNISEKITNNWKSVILSTIALLKWLYLPDQSKVA